MKWLDVAPKDEQDSRGYFVRLIMNLSSKLTEQQMQDAVENALAREPDSYVLRRGRGRPRHLVITQATRMRAEGKSWPEVYKSCLQDRGLFASAHAYRKAQRNLRKAVAQRIKRDINPLIPERGSSRQAVPPIQ